MRQFAYFRQCPVHTGLENSLFPRPLEFSNPLQTGFKWSYYRASIDQTLWQTDDQRHGCWKDQLPIRDRFIVRHVSLAYLATWVDDYFTHQTKANTDRVWKNIDFWLRQFLQIFSVFRNCSIELAPSNNWWWKKIAWVKTAAKYLPQKDDFFHCYVQQTPGIVVHYALFPFQIVN